MSDFEIGDIAIAVDREGALKRPPTQLLSVAVGLLCVSVIAFFISSSIGYAISIVASVVGSSVVFANLKRRSDPNYVTLDWFGPVVRLVRLLIMGVAFLHVLRLAIESAR
jgi:uncharacterized membrane protein YdjX (TVP38/TMEM64 family)